MSGNKKKGRKTVKRVKKTIVWLICMVMMLTFIPVIGMPAGNTDYAVYADENDVITDVQNGGFGDINADPIEVQGYLYAIADLLKTGFDPCEASGWTVQYLIPLMFGIQQEDKSEKILEQLSEVLQNQEKTM